MLVLVAVLEPSSPTPSRIAERNDLIERHARAIGGRAAIEAVRRLEIVLDIEEKGSKVEAVYRVDRDARMRIDVFSKGKRVYTDALSGARAWQQAGDGAPVSEASGAARAALWRGT